MKGSRSKMVSNLRVGHRVSACAYEEGEIVRDPETGEPIHWIMVVVAITVRQGSSRWNKHGDRFVVCVKETDARHGHGFDPDGYSADLGYRFRLIERMRPLSIARIGVIR